MNLVKYLSNGIPLAEAADFFIRVKQASPLASPAALPDTGKGMNMSATPAIQLPSAAQGMHISSPKLAAEGKDPEEVGKERGRANAAAHFEKEKAHKHEANNGLLGRLAGAAVGMGAAHKFGKGDALGTAAGGALGQHLGARFGAHMGAKQDAMEHAKLAFKLAAMEMGGLGLEDPPSIGQPQQQQGPPPAPPPPPGGHVPQLDPETAAYVAQQQAAEQEAEANQVEFLRQKLQEAQAEVAAASEQSQMLTDQQAQHDAQLQQIQAQVADSTSKSMLAQDQVLQQQQAAAAMRLAYQQLRGNLLQIASTDPPTLSPDAAALAAINTQQQGQQGAPTAGAPAEQAGPAGQAPAPGTAPGAPAPEGDATVAAPAASPEQPETKPAETTGQKDQQKAAGVLVPFVGRGKTASLGDYLGRQAGALKSVLPHAAIGAGVGALGAYGMSQMSNDPLRKRVDELEAKPDRGAGDTMNLAQARGRLTVGEHESKHPFATAAIGALGGAALGATAGPRLAQQIPQGYAAARDIGKNIKTMVSKGAA